MHGYLLNATLPDFWSLWIECQDYLYSACLKWMGNIPDAEDIMSQAMLKAEKKMSIYEVKNFRHWVTKLTYNLCLDFQRKRYQTIQYGDIQNVTSNSVDKHEENLFLDLQKQELEEVFSVWIDELRPILRDTFILHFKEQLSYIEIAHKLNISCCNVRRRIYQARQILRQRYDQDYIGEDQNKSEFVPEINRNKESDQITKIGLANSRDIELPVLELSNQEELPEAVNSQVLPHPNPPLDQGRELDSGFPSLSRKKEGNSTSVYTVSLKAIPCPFPVGWVKRQRNPTHLLGFHAIAPRSRSVPQGYVYVTRPNLQIKLFHFLMIIYWTTVSTSLAVIVAAFPLKAPAQNADIDFIGTIPSVVKINSVSPGSVQETPNANFAGNDPKPAVLNITHTSGIVLTITNIADNGTVLSSGKTYNNLDLINAKIKDGDNLLIQSEISPSGRSTPVYPLNVASAVQAAVTSGKEYLVYLQISNISGLLPQGTYKIRVSVLITPQ